MTMISKPQKHPAGVAGGPASPLARPPLVAIIAGNPCGAWNSDVELRNRWDIYVKAFSP
jgi:hypothetical protein